MHYTKAITFYIFLLMWVFSRAQESFRALAETSIAINHKVSKNYNVNFATRSRSFLYRNQTLQYQQQQLDIFHFSTLVLDYSHDLSFGIYYRNRDIFDTGSDELRLTQQFNYKKQKLGVRFGHRFRSEQRFFNDRTVFRQRYRFTIDFPLNGEKLDIGELYFVSSLEGLLNLSKPDIPEIDQRTTVQIGWQLTENLKLQAGLEYRLESFNVEAQNNLFILSSGILKI